MTERAPWRKVVKSTRNSITRSVTNWLECGDYIIFRGEKALDAMDAKKRRCHKCLKKENGHEPHRT